MVSRPRYNTSIVLYASITTTDKNAIRAARQGTISLVITHVTVLECASVCLGGLERIVQKVTRCINEDIKQ